MGAGAAGGHHSGAVRLQQRTGLAGRPLQLVLFGDGQPGVEVAVLLLGHWQARVGEGLLLLQGPPPAAGRDGQPVARGATVCALP